MPKIMLAEDDPTMLGLLKTLMRLEGFDVVIPDFQSDFIETVHREAPDALLMDVHLPQGNGMDFLRQMRSDPRFDGLKVVMASGMDLRYECMNAGANAFLLKPFMPETLINAIRAQLSGPAE
jgi:two-component system phosphate regulon response regulator PhoB